jgi:aspartate kinase
MDMLIVEKYGGTSLGDRERIFAAARRAAEAVSRGEQVVLVVSARGHTTDRLEQLAREMGFSGPGREKDALLATGEQESAALMAMALESLGAEAVSLTGWQAGIRTDGVPGNARILDVDHRRLRRELDRGRIPVVTGFQGLTPAGDIITLGRGGSDTTAVMLARALGAGCRIYTDVCGVYSADPAKVPGAVRHSSLDYDVMDKLAHAGAKVLHGKAALAARNYDIPLQICSSLAPQDPGTYIRRQGKKLPVAGVTCHCLPEDGGLHRLTVVGHGADTPWFLVRLERGLTNAGVCGAPLGGDALCRWALVPEEKADAALRSVHREFF